MESDRFISKLAMWAFILQKYNFDIVHMANRVYRDAHWLSRNPSFSEEDTIGAKWHVKVDLEVVPQWHVYVYLCTFTSRNQPKCNQSIYDYMRLIVVCD
jgi:hypothetical protein